MAEKDTTCLRTNSLCGPPESDLLQYVQENNVEKISRLVKNNKNLLDHLYSEKCYRPILHIALSERAEAETIKTLINLGADLYFSSKVDGNQSALHFAACGTRSDALKIVIENLKKKDDINASANGNTALHTLIKQGKSEMTEEFVKCAKLLLRKGINVNLTDKKGMPAIQWAIKKRYKHIIKLILEDSCMPVDLDDQYSKGNTFKDVIINDNLYDGPLPDKNSEKSLESRLFQLLKTRRETEFVEINLNNATFANGRDISNVLDPTTNLTLLQTSCKGNLKLAVEHLLRSGADPTVVATSGEAPIQIAAEKGRWNIFQLLLDHYSDSTHIPNSILTTLLTRIDYDQCPEAGTSHEKCYEILLKRLETNQGLLDVNEPDPSNNYPLHHAIRYADCEKTKQLLELGASLGSKNNFGVMPVQDIEPEMLKEHLDNCVQFELLKKIDKQDFLITFDYRTLIPPSRKCDIGENFDSSDPEINLNDTTNRELVAETEVIAYMSETAEFKYLLTHPVIVSFLFMKWQRISWLFYVNLIFYVVFSCSLVIYIFASYTNPEPSDSTFFVLFLAYTSKALFCMTFVILVFRELFQMAISPKGYFKNFENYIEIILIFCTGSILCNANILEETPIDDTKKILSAISILLAAFELVLMVGQHPKLSTNVVMLKTVSFNFFKFLVWYSLLIIAFALSFYILFSETKPVTKNETIEAQEEEDLFAGPGKSVFKTVVMLTGEFDASSMNFHRFPITSKIVFSLFIFMIAIILVNLLNGLAVSDTQLIRSDAELVGHVTRAQHIRYVESMILGNVLPSKLIRAFKNLCCCLPGNGTYNFSIFQPLARRVCLFPHCLINYKLSFYPNEGGRVMLPKGTISQKSGNQREISHCYSCSNLYLDKSTIKRTKVIVNKKREAMKRKKESNDIQKSNEKFIMAMFDNYVKNNGNKQT